MYHTEIDIKNSGAVRLEMLQQPNFSLTLQSDCHIANVQ